jgi:hypothetical protein
MEEEREEGRGAIWKPEIDLMRPCSGDKSVQLS